ncbi:MAG: farnesyl-diphosphate synthase [Porticoccaceae bacterium]|nr:MAG: farnesyl-diphosphate synthase [Porticoccaceae bacterium]
MELIHAYSLVHDDLPAMDDDQLRRGRPTCHVAFDEATAILAGDALQALAFAVLAEAEGDPATRVELIRLLAQAAGAAGMVLGQAEDLEATGRSLDLEALERMHRHKTGALICASLELGARSAGANGEELEALRRYGDALGLAFQIRDDILDVESSAEQLGKTPGSDAARNKPTYASVLGLAEARSRLEAAHAAAQDALKPFGERARTLRALAHFAAHRIH